MDDAKAKNDALKLAMDNADALKAKWADNEKKRMDKREEKAKEEYDLFKVEAVKAVKAQKEKHAALQKAEKDLHENKDKAQFEAL